MAKDLSTTEFDYSALDEDTASKLEYFAKTGQSLIRKSQIEFIAQLGELLSDARKVLASHNKHEGTFVKWATTEFDIGKQTVFNYVNAWDRMLSNGWTTYQHLSPTALYLLASEDTPKPVLKKIEKLAASGGTVRRADIQRLIDTSVGAKKGKEIEHEDSSVGRPAEGSRLTDTGEAPTTDAGAASPPSASIVLDSLDRPIPPEFREANQLGICLNSTGRDLDKFRKLAKEMSELPGGEWLRLQEIDDLVRNLKGQFQLARYHTLCHRCDGKGGECNTCFGRGFLPEYLKATI